MNLYIHVPFCVRKCNYCAFYSLCPDTIDWDDYAAGILGQLDELQRFTNHEPRITTLFFGGGTPSLMPPKYAEKIVGKLRLAPDAEFSMEANPKTLNPRELKDWKDLGLDRLSVGMQSFDDEELRFLGRIHGARDALDLLNAANDLKLRVNGDFIYGLPNQKVSDVIKLCEKINAIGLKSASLYELTPEAGTSFQNMPPVSEKLSAEMYSAIQRTLKLPRYEVSNYGDPCRHNMNVWTGGEYMGVGESAAGRIIKNGKWFETKITGGEIAIGELTDAERAAEILMTGLRTKWGVSIASLPKDVIDWNFVANNPTYFVHEPRTTNHGPRLRMTDSGISVLDALLPKVIK